MIRASPGSRPKYSARPPTTPAIMRSRRERRSGGWVLIAVVRSVRPERRRAAPKSKGLACSVLRLRLPMQATLRVSGACSTRALGQPLVYRRRHFALRTARHVDPDVAALEGELGIVLGADVFAQRTRGRRRNQVILLGEDVQHRDRDVLEADRLAAYFESAFYQLIALV